MEVQTAIFGKPDQHGLFTCGYALEPAIRDASGHSAMSVGKAYEPLVTSDFAFSRNISKQTRALVLERNGYTCQMCGVAAGDPDPMGSNRTVRLTMGHIKDKSLGGDDTPQNLRTVCTTCNEGLQNTAPPKPETLQLLAQVRRATISDQKLVLDWLNRKFDGNKG